MTRHAFGVLALVTALGVGMACSVILDFDLEVECWCGERWIAQVSGAESANFFGGGFPILATDTTHEMCVTQLEHIALATANPDDPVYVALRDSFESGAIANCESAGAMNLGDLFASTTCAMVGVAPVSTNITHAGACWDAKKVVFDDPEPCPLDSECGEYYDCSREPIVGIGDDEGGDGLAWECVPR